MKITHHCLVAVTACAGMLSAAEDDYYISVALKSGIYRVDATTLVAEPFAVGLGIPFYGFHDEAANFYVPDRALGAIFRIDPAGGIHPITAGGLISSTVAIVRDPTGGIMATDLPQNHVVRVGFDGTQTLVHDAVTSGGLLNGPGGLAFDRDGNLYVANNIGNTIVKIDPSGVITPWSASPLISAPGGVAIDGSGNMFVAMYDTSQIVRFRLDTAEAEVFAQAPLLMIKPNDLKLSRTGGLLTTTKASNLLRIDALGQVSEIYKNVQFGEIVGVAVPKDWDPCDGTFEPYGAGKPGEGGVVPEMRALFSPCPGEEIALEWRGFAGGIGGLFFIGFAATNVPLLGGSLLVDLSGPHAAVPLVFPGSGPGAGELTIPFTVDANPALVGLKVYFQTLGIDPAATFGVSFSNGVEEVIGS